MAMPRTVSPLLARLLVAVAAFLLVSMGGAIVAAPLTLPMLYLVVRADRTGPGLRAAAVTVAALTVVEIAWAATYLAVDEAQPWIWLLPLAAGATVVGAPNRGRRWWGAQRSCRSQVTD